MTKEHCKVLGLDKIYDLLEVPSDYMVRVKRKKLAKTMQKAEEVRSCYRRISLFINTLKVSTNPRWQELLAHIPEIKPERYSEERSFALHEIYEFKCFLYHYEYLREYAAVCGLESYNLPCMSELFKLLDPEHGRVPSFRLSPLYSEELTNLDKERTQLASKIKHSRMEYLQEARTALTNSSLKDEFVLSRSQADLIQTLLNSQYFTVNAESITNLSFVLADSKQTNSLKVALAEVNRSIEQAEEKVLEMLSTQIRNSVSLVAEAYFGATELGWDYMLASFAVQHDCCIPQVLSDSCSEIIAVGAVNLPLKDSLATHDRQFQSINFSFSTKTNLITGPNMGGKTSILKCLGQFCSLVSQGIPIPALEARIPLYDFIYYNHQSETENLSSFGSEVVAFCSAINQKGRGLFLLDEFAKGTNPTEGEALASAVIGYLAKSRHTCVAATHFSAPTKLKDMRQFRIKGISSSFTLQSNKAEELGTRLRNLANAMDYELVLLEEFSPPAMDAIRIAEALGMPSEVLSFLPKE